MLAKELTRMHEGELQKFVADSLVGRIWTSALLEKREDPATVWLPILFGAFSGWTEEDRRQIGVVWEYTDKALPRSPNGLPMFPSMRVMHIDDWKRAYPVIIQEQERMKDLDLPQDTTTKENSNDNV